jgi:predicted nucleotidyltransferase
MNLLIQENRQELERVCRVRRVRRIELFGSAAGPGFDAERSDLDFLVSFQELAPGEYADAYFGLLEDLQALFQRPVDLVVDSAFQNPYFRQTVDATRTLVYAD